jgi:alanyl-tRNA synthetase
MVQFKDTFLGLERRPYSRATTAQKCMRVSGKHNDFENVGPSPRHHTFFEMLGNFSFGDYFKQEAIRFAWTLLVDVWKLEPERLWFTIFEGDDEVPADEEAAHLWESVGAPRERILRFSRKENFWQMADTGPCGPNSEIHYYRGPNPKDPNSNRREYVNGDGEETIELWNLVFMQYNRVRVDGDKFRLEPLPKPSVDTGAGLERVAAIVQGKSSNYDTDLFVPIINRTRELLGQPKEDYDHRGVSYRVIADHSRAVTFMIADGIVPSNEKRGYVLRLILRRAARHGRLLGFDGPFLDKIIPTVIELMSGSYPEVARRQEAILKVARAEEERFLQTLRVGEEILGTEIAELKKKGLAEIPGELAFRLHDTFGFPIELTEEEARENHMSVDVASYRKAREEASSRSRASSKMGEIDDAGLRRYQELLQNLIRQGTLPANGVGYDPYSGTSLDADVAALLIDRELSESANEGESVQVVLSKTCFYIESGGQISDIGQIISANGEWQVLVEDVRQPIAGLVIHFGRVVRGIPRVGDPARAEVDTGRRWDIMRNHTATHLLHAQLRKNLGTNVQQSGSLVAPDRLRFDFTHNKQLTSEELDRIERGVNDWILANYPVEAAILSYKDAIGRGAMALFTEKYGDVVRMMEIDGISRELCGGTHVPDTSQVGVFHITSETSIGSGLRRIEAVTGREAIMLLRSDAHRVQRLSESLGTTPHELEVKVAGLKSKVEEQQKEIGKLQSESARRQADELLSQAEQVNGVKFIAAQIDATSIEMLRELTDYFRDKIGSGVIVLGAAIGNKPNFVAQVTPDLVDKGYHAGNIIRRVAAVVGGSGGGKANLAQAGGKDLEKLPAAIALVKDLVRRSDS